MYKYNKYDDNKLIIVYLCRLVIDELEEDLNMSFLLISERLNMKPRVITGNMIHLIRGPF